MRRSGFLVLALLLAALAAGCFTAQPDKAISRFDFIHPFAGPQGDNVVQLDVAIVERTVGDGFLNNDLWQLSDEAIDPALKLVLQNNGIRAGQLGSTPGPGLLDLLRSEKCCVNPRRILTRAGNATPIFLGDVWSSCRFDLDKDKVQIPVQLEKAQCVVMVTPALTDDGGVTLRFTPEVRHGPALLKPHSVRDPSGGKSWTWTTEQETETYAWLSWELTVKPDEFVVVGTLLDQPDSLGCRCFLFTETNTPVQRLLVIRPWRAVHEKSLLEECDERALPVALQARGSVR